MPCYYIWTIGCQMNKADSEHIASYLEGAGYSPVTSAEEADFVLLNSCVVRQNAENKVLNKLNSAKALKKKSPDVTIALTGCLVDSQTEKLRESFPWVDLIFGPQQWEILSEWVESHEAPHFEGISRPVPRKLPVSVYVPIMHGCNSFCSYCIVPYRRGRERSRDLEEICCEVRTLVEQGVREITLLGQSIGSYGHDLPYKPDLADLLGELNRIEGLLRIRFLTNHPKDMSQKLIQAVAELKKVCEHISLPLQAGDDEILRAMRRGYTAEQYQNLVAQIRSTIPDVALSTDIIVGFPDETDEQFERTLDLLQRIRFDRVHVAAYSTRPGTIASRRFDDSVSAEKKEFRLQQVEALHQSIAAEINAAFLGKAVEVLVEGKKKGKWQGRTRGDKLVFFSAENECLTGQLVQVEIEKTSAWALQGRMA
jgi:tRNA-2-methylthio-N6-dimethylallyladenosine synthase